ncbi:MAG: Trk system potassium transporter TrkA [Clostridia bacterium]|nr:Trk system potassium transporter TrkA [Clostridia bacterium]
MNIIIVGCGQVGTTLASQLNAEGHNITVIDMSAEKVKMVTNKIDAMGVIGNGASHLTQQEANIKEADLLIAVTDSDELNLLCCIIAKKEGSCQTIARVRDPAYNGEASYLKNELGLAMVINPELAAAEEIARVLRFPSAISIETFAKGKVELLKFKLPEDSPIVGMSVRDVMASYKCDILFCTAERGDDAYITKGDFVFEAKDIISIIASPRRAAAFFKKINYKTDSVKDAIIVGGGEITHYLCAICKGAGINLKVIDDDAEVCEEFCAEFPYVTVINADTSEQEALQAEGVARADAFLALKDLDEENIFLSLYAKGQCHGKLVTKIKRIDYDDVIGHLELDTVIYPKNITANMIVRYARAMGKNTGSNMETFYSIIKGKIDAYEFIIREGSPVVGKPLAELRFRRNVLIAAILRGKQVITPRGYDSILPGDSVVVVSEAISGLGDISDLLEEKHK